jgi:hypothetical protein
VREDGAVKRNAQAMTHARIQACPVKSLSPTHYRADGTCVCTPLPCTVPWCTRDQYALELCTKHYRRQVRHGEPVTPDERAAYEAGVEAGKAALAAMM